MAWAARQEAAGGQRDESGRFTGPLASLRYHWGEAYRFGQRMQARGVLFTARRRDGKGQELADPLAEGLRLLVIRDYCSDPVPR